MDSCVLRACAWRPRASLTANPPLEGRRTGSFLARPTDQAVPGPPACCTAGRPRIVSTCDLTRPSDLVHDLRSASCSSPRLVHLDESPYPQKGVTTVEIQHLTISVQEHIAVITLNRPEFLNAFTPEMLDGWLEALTRCQEDEGIRAVIITGQGKAFCAGGDIKHFLSRELTAWDMKNFLQQKVHRVALAMDRLDKPLIAAVNGAAHGAGMDMALLCDLRIASDRAEFRESYIALGMAPGDGGAFLLPRVVGTAKAMEWLLTGNPISLDEALRFGLVNKVVPHDTLMDQALSMARIVSAHSPLGVRLTKRAVKQGLSSDLANHLDYISSQMGLLCETPHFREAVESFLSRRKEP